MPSNIPTKQTSLRDFCSTRQKPPELDWSSFKNERLGLMARSLAIKHVDLIEQGVFLELGTVEAMMHEIEVRVGIPSDSVVIPPAQALVIIQGGIDDLSQCEEERRWAETIRAAKTLYIVMLSSNPNHYTYLEVTRGEADDHKIVYKDSLAFAAESKRASAKALLEKLDLVTESFQGTTRINETFQQDEWSCGIWAARWLEQSLREARGEARQAPASLGICVTRANEFIQKLKNADVSSMQFRRRRWHQRAEAETQASATRVSSKRACRRNSTNRT